MEQECNTQIIKRNLDEAQNNLNVARKKCLEAEKRVLELQNELNCAYAAEKADKTPRVNDLSNDEIARYARQLIIPGFGVHGQEQLKNSAILIVGMGGLGCPAAQYLAAAGVGKLGLVDYDKVERSNFHRQTLHNELQIGKLKVASAHHAIKCLNTHCKVQEYSISINSKSALELVREYDVILDCSDNPPTRYLLNDACVLTGKPLVSGSALQLDGQLTVYNYNSTTPCYRCMFPQPPAPETVSNCSDAGVLGAITGVIGSLQALEAIKIIVNLGEVLAGRMLIFDGASLQFRCIKLRGRRTDCAVCSEQATIKQLLDYEQFCGQLACEKTQPLNLLNTNERITVFEYDNMLRQKKKFILLDVRTPAEFEICRLPNSINMPLANVLNDNYLSILQQHLQDKEKSVIFICRRGNDSQLAVQHARRAMEDHCIKDIIGGLHQWHYKIDNDFPIY